MQNLDSTHTYIRGFEIATTSQIQLYTANLFAIVKHFKSCLFYYGLRDKSPHPAALDLGKLMSGSTKATKIHKYMDNKHEKCRWKIYVD